MSATSRLWLSALAVLCINLPFGYWRGGVRKFSIKWFLAVHLPVPLVVAVRFVAGLGFQLVTYPVLVGAFFGGQLLGSRLRAARGGASRNELESESAGGDA
jgi:hypothetical protein